MKLVIFSRGTSEVFPGLLLDDGVVSLAELVPAVRAPRAAMLTIIEGFETLKRSIERLGGSGEKLPLDLVQLHAPIPWPGKILSSTSVCRAERNTSPEPLLMTLKTAECVIGPRDDIELPDTFEPWQLSPEAELAAIIKGPAKRVAAEDWRSAVFGFSCAIDVAARGQSPAFGRDLWVAKSDTLCPLGPCIVTADEFAEPANLHLRSFLNGQPRQDFTFATADYDIGQQIAFITTVMTLHSGDIVLLGSSEQDAGELHDGDRADVEIEDIGRLSVGVRAAALVAGGGAAT
ncbi:MAG: fumarylacetoacetate hydrolase family protein [Chloroflexota bacterium]